MNNRRAGQSLVELLIALTIFVITISAVTIVFFGGENLSRDSLSSHQALQRAHNGMEAIRSIRSTNWTSLTNGLHGLERLPDGSWTLTGTPDISDGFTRTVSISTESITGLKNVELTVSWPRLPEGTKTVTLHQKVAPLEEGIFGDWQQPCVLSSADGDSGAKGTDVFYAEGKAYVTSSQSSANKKDFFIFDVSDPASPVEASSLNTGKGLRSVNVNGSYAYAVEEDDPEFLVINVSNPAAPVVTTQQSFSGGDGRYVVTRDAYAYVATTNNTSGREFFVFDVATPTAPVVVASLEIGANVNEISILQNIAYLATSSDTKELIAIDITNPLAPFEVSGGSLNLPGTSDATALHAKAGKRLYISKALSSDDEFYIIDVTNPASMVIRGSTDTTGTINSLFTAGTLTFVGTDITNEEFENYYIRFPDAIQKYGGLNFSNVATGTSYDNNIVYFSLRNGDILQLITSTINGVCGG